MRGWGPNNVTSKFSKLLFVTLASGIVSFIKTCILSLYGGRKCLTLESQIASSLMSGKDCLLNTAEWAKVMESALADSERGSKSSIWIQVWQINARFPSIVQLLKNSPGDSFPEIRTIVLDLWAQVTNIEIEAELSMRNPDFMLEMPSELAQSPLPTYYVFHDLRTAEVMCHFWKQVMLIVQFMKFCGLEEYTYTYTHKRPDIVAATNICRTVEYAMLTKPLGAWYMPLVLPLAAYVLSDVEYLKQYAIWAYNDIIDSGLAIGLDMGVHGRNLLPATEGLHPAAYQKWWFGT